MKLNQRGMTLIELGIVVMILGTLSIWMGTVLQQIFSRHGTYGELQFAELGATSNLLTREITNFFSRGRDVQTTQFGAASPGFLIKDQGAIVVRSDLRSAATFNPTTSTANLSRIGISCCQPNLSINAAVPGGGTVNLTSACPSTEWGLTIRVFNPSGGLVESRCFKNLTSMSVLNLGNQPHFANAPLYLLDFSGETVFDPNNQPLGLRRAFFSQTVTLGNGVGSPLITLSRTGQFN